MLGHGRDVFSPTTLLERTCAVVLQYVTQTDDHCLARRQRVDGVAEFLPKRSTFQHIRRLAVSIRPTYLLWLLAHMPGKFARIMWSFANAPSSATASTSRSALAGELPGRLGRPQQLGGVNAGLDPLGEVDLLLGRR